MATPNGTFKGVNLGEHCFLETAYNRTVQVERPIRANGSFVQNIGGGLETLTVTAWKIFSSVDDAEVYAHDLILQLGNSSGTLVVNSQTYTNCFLQDISTTEEDHPWVNLSFTFIRNPF